MYNSIASVELVSHMQHQFPTAPDSDRATAIQAATGLRQRLSAMLHALASALAPAPAPAH